MVQFYLKLPFVFLQFWYQEAPVGLLKFFGSFNHAFLQFFSLPLLLKTYFKPWKNEYRKGLVGFSIGMGIFIKSFVILFDIVLLLMLLFLEWIFIIVFLLLPIIAFTLLFL